MNDARQLNASDQLSGALHLAAVSFRRLLVSRQTVVCLLFLALAVVGVIGWSMRHERTAAEFAEQIVLPLYVPFLLPIFSLTFATASIAADREDESLVYLLITPIPRPLIYLSKLSAALLLVLMWTLGGLAILCLAAGEPGRAALPHLWPAVFMATLAYVALFHLFGSLFRRATIVALIYALFMEDVLGNMPGIVKRVAVSFYARCMMYESGAAFGLGGPSNPELFLPIEGRTALYILAVSSAALLIAGLWVFSRREYV